MKARINGNALELPFNLFFIIPDLICEVFAVPVLPVPTATVRLFILFNTGIFAQLLRLTLG